MDNEVLFWHWWILGGVFLILEMLVPGTFMLWPAIAAGLVGVMLLVAPGTELPIQLISFAVVAVVSVIAWRMYLKRHPIVSDEPTLNQRGQQYITRVFSLREPIVNGIGKAAVDDTVWTVRAKEDMPLGTLVRCTGVDGTVLVVERAS